MVFNQQNPISAINLGSFLNFYVAWVNTWHGSKTAYPKYDTLRDVSA
jgi:hypothetical protein